MKDEGEGVILKASRSNESNREVCRFNLIKIRERKEGEVPISLGKVEQIAMDIAGLIGEVNRDTYKREPYIRDGIEYTYRCE